MDKKALLAVVLSFMVLYVYQSYFMPPVPVDVPVFLDSEIEGNSTNVVEKDKVIIKESIKKPETKKIVKKTEAVKEVESILSNESYSAVFSNIGGGGLKSLKLNNYKETLDLDSAQVDRINTLNSDPLPLSISFKARGIDVSRDTVYELKKSDANSLVYGWSSGEGIEIEKKYSLDKDDYSIGLEINILNSGSETIEGKLGLSIFERYNGEDRNQMDIHRQVVKIGDELERIDFDKLKKEDDVQQGNINWAALEDKYFITVIIPEKKEGQKVTASSTDGGLIASTLEKSGINIKSGEKLSLKYKVYSGPKDFYILQKTGSGIEEAIDLGWFHAIAEPLLRFLKFIYSFTGNYGYAIIIVTFIIKIIFFPLANKSYKSMKEMQKLQPKMAELREKYKDEKEKMSREVMELYRKHKVNPLSGCLPMIVQIPVFIALYNVLMNAIELRHAPFHLWIVDMSSKDPYYITPLVMGATMFLQQRMSPSAPDPTQQKVMMMMPIIFTFMFMNLPAGLVLYWVVNNTLSIGQQYYILKKA